MGESLDDLARRQARLEGEALAREERMFSDMMVESMPGILYFYDMEGQFLRWNKNFEKVSGYSAEEIAGMHPLDFFTKGDKGLIEERIAEVFTKGESSVEALFLAKDGRTTPYFFTGRKVEFSNRLCLVGVGIDVSERKLAEAALRVSEHRYRTTLDSILEGCQLVGFDGRFLYVNDAAVAHNRRPKSDLLGRKITEVWPGIEQAPFYALIERGLKERLPGQEEVEFQFKDGTRGWFDLRVQPVDEGVLLLSIERTQRKLALDRLTASEQKYRELVENANSIILRMNSEGKITLMNEFGLRFFGYTAEEIAGRHLLETIVPSTESSGRDLQYLMEQICADPKAFEQNVNENIRRNGERVWVSWTNRIVQDEQGRVQEILSIGTDITEKRRAEMELRRSTELLRAVADNSPDAIFVKDMQGRYLLFNEGAARLVGRSAAEVLGKDDTAIFSLADVLVIKTSDMRVIESGEVLTTEDVLTAAGVTRTYLATKAPYRDVDGKIIGLVGISRDITERKRAAELIRVNEERFQLVAKATKDAIWDWDLVVNTLWWGQSFETLFGFQRREVEPSIESWTNRLHPEDHARVVDGIHAAIDKGESSWTDEYRFRRKDGSYAYVLDRGYILRDEEGKAIRMIGGITDISERRVAEEKLREQATLLDKAQDAILVRDLEHRVLFWNKSAERVYGWTAEEVMGRPLPEFLYKDDTAFKAATAAVLKQGEWVGEIDQKTKAGADIVVEARWTLVRDEAGQPKSILAINTDITQRKKLERQFLRTQRMESIGTLAGGIAHDLNNVLAPIIMSANLLKLEEADPDRVRILDTIETSASRGAAMVGQVLSFARGLEGRRVEVQAKHLIRDIIKITNETFPKNIRLQSRVSKDLWVLKADPTQLHQVLLNLCVNARDAMPDGGQITIMADNMMADSQYVAMNIEAREGPYLKIEVEDSGTGIPKNIIDSIFDPFFTTKEVGKGTGLGLSTVQAIVKGHGGFIRVYSEPGMGAKFSIYLPAEGTSCATETTTGEVKLPRGKGETVLVVDDEISIRQITKQTLEAFGYKVLLAVDGSEAISEYVKHQKEVALVLTDMMMPIMDGPATIQVLKRLNPDLRIIGASGINANSKVAQASGLGVAHFLPKPYTAEVLLNTIHEVLAAPAKS
ncbi:MAG TPA: PAS domain S-box protein [Verrucomicrobiae bacterium]